MNGLRQRSKPLSSIKSGYKDSKYAIAVALINYPKDKWTKKDIEEATQKAATRIVNFIFS